jgi:DNA repair exonuclease SbcCD ATPase subunit/DNA repair exonuclease SbcCD nuclease subunit
MRIKVPFNTLQHIAHIADVHIRLFRRHDEYQQAFEKLYTDLESVKESGHEDFVIVLAGDIVHAKTDMSPEMVEVTSTFLSRIADIAPTILIAGNHDCNLANTHRLDALTPIVNNLKHPNLYYIRNSAIVHVADTAFAVMSIFDEPDMWPSASEIDDATTKIALYHGPVHGAVAGNFTITNRHVALDKFDGFDLALLGDIHSHQTMQEYDPENGKPIVVYASSLIQQNFGETVENHGWCLWDVPTRTFEFVELDNDYGYVTLEVVNGQFTIPSRMPKNVRLRLFTGDLDATEVKKLVTTLRNKHNIIEMSVNKSRYTKTIDRDTTISHEHLDLTQINVQNALITDWLARNYSTLDPDVLSSIEKINKELNGKIVHDDHSRNIHWRPLKFTFSNMFSYGEDNEIDFTDMRGIYGVFAPNASGKSSVMDALMFCLYDKTPRAFKGDHIINNRKDSFTCELTFEINGETFGINRIGTRKKNGDVKVDVQFWKESDGSRVSLNGEDRRDTNANIRSYVGTYEDFVMTTLSSQSSNSLFIDKSHSERKDLLIQFMGLNVFDKLFEAAHDESKEIAGILKRFKKSDVTDALAATQDELQSAEEVLLSYEEKKKTLLQTRDTLDIQLETQQAKKLPTPPITTDITTLRSNKNKWETAIKKIEQDIQFETEKQGGLQSDLEQLFEDCLEYDVVELEGAVDLYKELNSQLETYNAQLRLLTNSIGDKEGILEKLTSYKYNPDCAVCVSNNTKIIKDVQQVNADLDKLNADRLLVEMTITNIINQIEPLEAAQEDYAHLMDLQEQITKLEQDSQRIEGTISAYTLSRDKHLFSLQQVETDIAMYETNEANIVVNMQLDEGIRDIQQQIMQVKTQLQQIDTKLQQATGKVSVLKAKKTELLAKLREAEELETTYEAYNHYMLAVGRDGVPYEMMGKAIPQIESEINTILAQLVDFTISLEVDGKNINGKLTYDYDRIWPLENSSGMERFVSGLAIRVALMNASNLPKSNFLIVDEGFGTLDAEHIHSMQTLFNLLKTHFDFIFIVSHLETMRDMVDHIIEIKKEDGYSQISI